eukprot:COSAG05_NODE_23048_length_260_cov_1.267081_1_plen_72_part_01
MADHICTHPSDLMQPPQSAGESFIDGDAPTELVAWRLHDTACVDGARSNDCLQSLSLPDRTRHYHQDDDDDD